MKQGSKMAMGIKLIDIRVAKPVFAKVKRESHVDKTRVPKVQAKKSSLCFLFKVNALFLCLKKSHKTG